MATKWYLYLGIMLPSAQQKLHLKRFYLLGHKIGVMCGYCFQSMCLLCVFTRYFTFHCMTLSCGSNSSGHMQLLVISMWPPFTHISVLPWVTSFQISMLQQHSGFPDLENENFNHWTAWLVLFCLSWLAIKSVIGSTWFLCKGWLLFYLWVRKLIIYEYNKNALWKLAH